jgi:hypothetical protein
VHEHEQVRARHARVLLPPKDPAVLLEPLEACNDADGSRTNLAAQDR